MSELTLSVERLGFDDNPASSEPPLSPSIEAKPGTVRPARKRSALWRRKKTLEAALKSALLLVEIGATRHEIAAHIREALHGA